MAEIIVTPRAQRDVDEAIQTLGLTEDTWARISHSLRVLRQFHLAGRRLEGRWNQFRFVRGPWPWMIVLYVYEPEEDVVRIVAVHDARSSTAPRPR